ncbi:hypothetical protein BV25DRAFT_1229188 [Artomyces pyxidatus]|uniref:Uncharacterized protein n=1 Tax=Artomyces pyxidatus TaxID=48021 RepID=A0ACB8SQQ7_9AGAM|nr:hypothetical protein BV25DRAFT_1229188 [Artomyces pyxidatus]
MSIRCLNGAGRQTKDHSYDLEKGLPRTKSTRTVPIPVPSSRHTGHSIPSSKRIRRLNHVSCPKFASSMISKGENGSDPRRRLRIRGWRQNEVTDKQEIDTPNCDTNICVGVRRNWEKFVVRGRKLVRQQSGLTFSRSRSRGRSMDPVVDARLPGPLRQPLQLESFIESPPRYTVYTLGSRVLCWDTRLEAGSEVPRSVIRGTNRPSHAFVGTCASRSLPIAFDGGLERLDL